MLFYNQTFYIPLFVSHFNVNEISYFNRQCKMHIKTPHVITARRWLY